MIKKGFNYNNNITHGDVKKNRKEITPSYRTPLEKNPFYFYKKHNYDFGRKRHKLQRNVLCLVRNCKSMDTENVAFMKSLI